MKKIQGFFRKSNIPPHLMAASLYAYLKFLGVGCCGQRIEAGNYYPITPGLSFYYHHYPQDLQLYVFHYYIIITQEDKARIRLEVGQTSLGMIKELNQRGTIGYDKTLFL